MEITIIIVGLIVNFLAILAVSWKGGEKIGTIETNISWLKKGIEDLTTDVDNLRDGAFSQASPISLTDKGAEILNGSGIKEYIEANQDKLIDTCKRQKLATAYDVQTFVFNMFDRLTFDAETDKKIKDYAFSHGTSTNIVNRVGAIYFRDMAIKACGFEIKDLDKAQSKSTKHMLK